MDFRTLLRGFLVGGGVAIAVVGVVEGSTFEIALGAFAALLGGFRLWSERRGVGKEG